MKPYINVTRILLFMLIVGCSKYPWNIQQVKLSNNNFTPRTPSEKIEIFTLKNSPDRKYIEIALMSIREKGSHAPSMKPHSMEYTLAEFKKKASEIGADAIIEVEFYHAKTGTIGAGSVSIDGVAVRWK